MHHPVKMDVVNEAPAPGQKSAIFDSQQR